MPIKKKKKNDTGSPKESIKKKGRPKKIKKEAENEKKEVGVKKPKLEKNLEIKKQTRNFNYALGRRKSAVARIHYYQEGNGEMMINNKNYNRYFPYFEQQKIVLSPLVLLNQQ